MCSRRYASSKRGGRKAEFDPPALFYNVSPRKASKNDAKMGFCGAPANYRIISETARGFFAPMPGQGLGKSSPQMRAGPQNRIKYILNKIR
ncbi:hypothetical protein MCBRY_001734 [Methylocystis bryophila]|uniref:Uncharacterized protein n=1 Tax=Methylocystis bryophila TaxID=655015 RepID=A0A1W6MRQ5_9HYPH|nr:hypothetical protein B1812_03335 [Methylocystis bryophila]